MPDIGIIGSGPSGMAAAYQLIQKGFSVEVLDVGRVPEPWSVQLADRITKRLKQGLAPSKNDISLLRGGKNHENQTLWKSFTTLVQSNIAAEKVQKKILGSPFVFKNVQQFLPTAGADIPLSLACGGLSNLWGAACYGLTDKDIDEWPIDSNELDHFYEQSAQILNLWQYADNLSGVYPLFGKIQPNSDIERNPNSPFNFLTDQWERRKELLSHMGIYAGKSRLAVQSPDSKNKETGGCLRCGLCFYGCPCRAIFSSSSLITQLDEGVTFNYQPDFFATRFTESDSSVVVHGINPSTQDHRQRKYKTLLLAGGPISTFKLVSDSLCHYQDSIPLIDNDLYIVPFLVRKTDNKLRQRGKSQFSLSEAVFHLRPGIIGSKGVHIQFYPFNDYFLGSLVDLLEKLPKFMRQQIQAFSNRLVIGFIYFHSDESRQATITCSQESTAKSSIHIQVDDAPPSRHLLKKTLDYLKKHSKLTSLLPIRSVVKETPFGFSGHVGGSLAMKQHPKTLQTDPAGRIHGYSSVYCVDSSIFPTMSAQNPTFTIMSNGMRIASTIRLADK